MLSRSRIPVALAWVASLAAPFLNLGLWLRPATAQLLGPEFQVNTFTPYSQTRPAVAADGSGNFVVVWHDPQDGSWSGVFGQRFDSAGSRVGSEFLVNTTTTNLQTWPTVAADGAGGFIVAWQSYVHDGSGWGVFGQRFDSAGSRLGSEFQVNTYTTSSQTVPALAADRRGNFVVVWESSFQDGSGSGVFGQRFDSAGSKVGDEFQANTYTTSAQSAPAVAVDGLGELVVLWESSSQDASYSGVFGQRYNSAGDPVGNEFQVNTHTTDQQDRPAVAADGTGHFVVAWESWQQESSGYCVVGQRYDPAGNSVGGEFEVSSCTVESQRYPRVAADRAGNFVVAWMSLGQDGAGWGVFGQRFNAAGGKLASAFQINAFTTDHQRNPALAADGSGNFVVAWESPQDGSSYGLFGRQMNVALFADGFELGDVCAWSAAVGSGDVCPP